MVYIVLINFSNLYESQHKHISHFKFQVYTLIKIKVENDMIEIIL